MQIYRNAFAAICASLALASAAPAQEAPTPAQILEAWLASPHAKSDVEAFRHWDDDAEIPGSCAVCHSTPGMVDYLANDRPVAGVIGHSVPIGTTVECDACHNDGAKALSSVIFPSGQEVSIPDSSAVCSVCHQGRASMLSVTAAVGAIGEDEVSPEIAFVNIHYSAAASTQRGATVQAGYQYEGKSYAGQFTHVPGFDTCVSCHNPHDTKVVLESCTTCHKGATDFRDIRTTPLDILGDGATTAGMATVVDTLKDRLRGAIMAYAAETGGAIVYSDAAYPYFFADLNGDGTAGPDEAIFPNRYQTWTPRLLKAAYNYQFVAKDKGAFTHNPHYALQLMIDSIEDLAQMAKIDTAGLVRP